jgi:phage major head subunit gpT-like protein
MTIFRSDIATHLNYGVRTGFLKGQKTYTSVRGAFVKQTTSDGKQEDYSDLGTVPMPVAYDDMVQVRGTHEVNLTITNKDWEITIGVSHNAINDDRVGNLDDWSRQAGRNFEKHMDRLCFLALNGGDGSTYGLAYDGLTFFNDSHLDPGAEYQTVQDNKYNLTLSLDNFETVRVATEQYLDGRGEYVMYDHSLLITSPALRRTALQITGNAAAYDTANNEINTYAGLMRPPLVSPYLDSGAWIVVAADEVTKPIILQVRQSPTLVIWDDEKLGEGGVRYYKFHARYNVGYGDWRVAAMGHS